MAIQAGSPINSMPIGIPSAKYRAVKLKYLQKELSESDGKFLILIKRRLVECSLVFSGTYRQKTQAITVSRKSPEISGKFILQERCHWFVMVAVFPWQMHGYTVS